MKLVQGHCESWIVVLKTIACAWVRLGSDFYTYKYRQLAAIRSDRNLSMNGVNFKHFFVTLASLAAETRAHENNI